MRTMIYYFLTSNQFHLVHFVRLRLLLHQIRTPFGLYPWHTCDEHKAGCNDKKYTSFTYISSIQIILRHTLWHLEKKKKKYLIIYYN